MKNFLRFLGSTAVLAVLVVAFSFGIFKHDDIRQNVATAVEGAMEKVTGSTESQAATVITPETIPEVPQEPAIPAAKYTIDKNYNVIPIDPAGDKNIVLLTIDDGPKAPKTLDPILKAMADQNVHAIFFVIGNLVKSKPEYLKEIADAGHTIGNHTWNHINLKTATNDKSKKEIDDTTAQIESATGITPLFFRPPYGASNEYVKTYIASEKIVFMTWSLGGEDWITKYQTKDALTKHVIESLHPGANILLHELSWTAAALPEIITQIKAKGYTIVDPKDIEVLN